MGTDGPRVLESRLWSDRLRAQKQSSRSVLSSAFGFTGAPPVIWITALCPPISVEYGHSWVDFPFLPTASAPSSLWHTLSCSCWLRCGRWLRPTPPPAFGCLPRCPPARGSSAESLL